MKKGFTLIELIAVITILAATITLIAVKVENTISDADDFGTATQISMIESAALIYANENTITNLSTYNVDVISLETLVTNGLIKSDSIAGINDDNLVLIAIIDDNLKVKYLGTSTSKPVIFLKGFSDVTVNLNDTYIDAGALVAIPETGLVTLTGTSTVNTSVSGDYTITYSYTNATTVTRNVKVK